jgi:hypothetical protein
MKRLELLWKLEGLHTADTVAEELHITRQSAINLLSRLKKAGHVTVSGGGRRVRLYKITIRKQLPREPGMFDVINKYSPHMKLAPWYDHQVHGLYGPEEALVDAIQTKSFRVLLASLHLFRHITSWPKLYALGKKHDCWQQVGALYDVARMFLRVRKMPERYRVAKRWRWKCLTQLKKKNFPEISNLWKIYIPFNKYDLGKL